MKTKLIPFEDAKVGMLIYLRKKVHPENLTAETIKNTIRYTMYPPRVGIITQIIKQFYQENALGGTVICVGVRPYNNCVGEEIRTYYYVDLIPTISQVIKL